LAPEKSAAPARYTNSETAPRPARRRFFTSPTSTRASRSCAPRDHPYYG
jgi:hypothetical protein